MGCEERVGGGTKVFLLSKNTLENTLEKEIDLSANNCCVLGYRVSRYNKNTTQ